MWMCVDVFNKQIIGGQQDRASSEITVIQDPVLIKINGADGVKYSWDTFLKNSTPPALLRRVNYDVLKNDKWIQILCMASKDDYETHAKEIETAINSLYFN